MATPALRALRQGFPRAHITAVLRPVIEELISGAWGDSSPWFDHTLPVGKSARSRWQLVRLIRAQKLDAIVLFVNSFWSATVARLAGVCEIVGYDRDMRGWLLTKRLPVPRDGRKPRPISAIDYYLGLVDNIGCDTSNRRMQLQLSKHEHQLAEAVWKDLDFTDTLPTIVVNSNSATSAPRVWPGEQVGRLAVKLATELGCQVLLHCGPRERDEANRVAAEANHPRVASLGIARELPIGLSKAVLAKASAVVSTDSGARHMAAALDRPVVSLFGPTDSAWTVTYNVPEELVEVSKKQLECRACYQDACPLKHHRCMREISVERVFDAVQRQLATKSAAA